MLNIFIELVVVSGVSLAVVYNTKYRNHPWDIYYPKLAWMRAGMYFCACYVLSYLSGGMELILTRPVFTPEQLQNSNWVIYTAGIAVFMVTAYAGVWSYFTPVFERRKNVLISATFGFLWGTSSGQLFLSVWVLTGHLPLPAWGSAVVAFLVLAAYQPRASAPLDEIASVSSRLIVNKAAMRSRYQGIERLIADLSEAVEAQ